jgi:cell division protein FtsL
VLSAAPHVHAGHSVSELLRELAALRVRLDRTEEWFSRLQSTLNAAALAEEVERLCREALRSSDPAEVAALLSGVRKRLDEQQVRLGSH